LANEDMGRLARLTVLAAAIASVANLAGGVIFSSRLLILNGLTCVANLVTAIAGLWFYREALKPPDADHPLGHAGYSFSSAAFTTSGGGEGRDSSRRTSLVFTATW